MGSAMGIGEEKVNTVHLLDLGLAKLFVNPITGHHIPFREGRVGLGTPRYASYNVHFGRGMWPPPGKGSIYRLHS